MDYFTRLKTRYTSELEGNIIPFWTAHGIDRQCGGFFSYLDRDGSVYDTRKPLWMQWRAVYMFAELYNHPSFRKEEYLEAAVKGFDFLVKNGKTAGGSYGFMLDRQGRMISEKESGREVFSDSFACLACAELYAATGDSRCEEESMQALRMYLKNTAKKANAEWYPLAWPMIRLNMLDITEKAFGDKIGEEAFRDCIEEIFTFLHPEKKVFLENQRPDGSFDLESQTGRFCKPGHALEGMSFILEVLRRRKERDPELVKRYLAKTLSCVEQMFRFGWDKEQGGILFGRDILDLPLQETNYGLLKVWWAQNETATATLRAYEASLDEKFLDSFEKVDAYSFLMLKDPEYPEWYSVAMADGKPAAPFKGDTWKGFFHLPRCLLDCIRICERLENKQ